MKPISLLLLFSFLVIASCRRDESYYPKTTSSPSPDSLIKKIEHFYDGKVEYTESFVYNEKNMLVEYLMNIYKHTYKYYNNDSLIVVNRYIGTSNELFDSLFFEGNKLVKKVVTEDGWNCEIYEYFYDENDRLIRQSYLSKDKTFYLPNYLTYKWENGNNISQTFANGELYFTNTFDISKPFQVGDIHYSDLLWMYGKIPSFANKNLCIYYSKALDSMSYLYDTERRIVGCTGMFHTFPENTKVFLKYTY